MLFLIIVIVYSLDTIRIDQSCSTGLTGYFWNGQQCIQCKKPACKCQQPYECTSCINNYYYDTNSKDCTPCPLGCIKCCKSDEMTQYICTLCQEKYIMISGICLYVGVCTQISIHGKCQLCPETYYLQEVCKKCPEGCASCDSSSYCTSCQDGYYSSIVDDKRLCASCNAEKLVGCNQCELAPLLGIDTLICMNCLDYYFFDEFTSECKKCPDNCLSCQNPEQIPQICYVCGVGYILTQENSVCQDCQDQIKNCMTCNINEHNNGFICVKCENGYYLSQDSLECIYCKTLTNHARRCNSEIAITQCEVGYLLLQDEFNNYSCVKNINNCYTISNDKAECFNCLPDYTLTLNIALQIQICQNCEQTIKNCLSCSTDSNQQLICKQCTSGYYGDQCIQCTQNCDVCLSQNQCSSCLSGYFLDDQKQCQSCEVDFCVSCTTIKQCTKCQLSFGLFDSKCQKCLVGCEICDSNLDKCDLCAENFYLTIKEKNCKRYKDNCVSSNINGYCYLCETVIDYDPYKEIFQDESIDNQDIYNVQPAIFYISNNGYCLKCNDESTGTYNCPQICKIEEQYQKILQLMMLLISILF